MKRYSNFERVVLMLTALVLLIMSGWFLAKQRAARDTWRVEVQRSDGEELSGAVREELWPDSLLEGEVINVNTASAGDLQRLPGIGPERARAIVADRQERGPFTRVEDLLRVDGIGTGTLEGIRPYVTVQRKQGETS